MADINNPEMPELDLPADGGDEPGLLDEIADFFGDGPADGPVMPGDLGAAVGDAGGQPPAPGAGIDLGGGAPVMPGIENPVDPGAGVGNPAPVDPAPVDPGPVDPGPVALPVDPIDIADPIVEDPIVEEEPIEDPVVVEDPIVDEPPIIHDELTDPPAVGDDEIAPLPVEPSVEEVPVEETPVDEAPVVADPAGGIDLPVVDEPPAELPSHVTEVVSKPDVSFTDVTEELTQTMGAPTEVPDFHVSAPTPDHSTLLLPDSPELPAMQVTGVDHAAGTVTAAPVGMPGAPEMSFPLADVQAAQAESGFSAVSFAGGAGAGAVALTVAAVAARRLRKA